MSDAVLASLIGAVGLVLSGVLVEMVRARRHTARLAAQVVPNGGSSLRDAVDRIERGMDSIQATQSTHGERLAAVETRVQILTERR